MNTYTKKSEFEAFRKWPEKGAAWGSIEPLNGSEDLLVAFEEMADERADDSAIFLKDPRVKKDEARYLSLSFSELKLERDAWIHRLRSAGVSDGDRVLIWLPPGLAMVAASFALLRMGVEIAIADESLDWGNGLCYFEPTFTIVSSAALSRCKRGLKADCHFLEVRSPLLRVAAGVKSSHPRRLAQRTMKSGVVFFREDADGVRRSVRFDAVAIAALLKGYGELLRIQCFETDAPNDCLMCFLNPALGVSSVFTEAGFGMDTSKGGGSLMATVEDLGVTRLTRSVREWEEIMGQNLESCAGLRRLFVEGERSEALMLMERLKERFPEADLYLVFGTLSVPVAAVCKLEDAASGHSELGVGVQIGRLLPGLQERIHPPMLTAKPGESDLMLSRIGELSFSGECCGNLLGQGDPMDEDTSQRTGYFAFEDDEGELWLCGKVEDAVQTSFGLFVPARCEPVFEDHEGVRRVVLFGLNSKVGTRPAILVEVEDGWLPKDALAESKLKAELMRLGADSSDTKMVLDMFFVETLPDNKSGAEGIDRAAISRRYSMRAKLRSVF